MIIDLHTRVWLSLEQLGQDIARRIRQDQAQHFGHIDASPAAHERAMSCVASSVVLGFRSELLGARVPNEYIAEYVAKDPRRRIGVAGVDPMSEDAVDQLEQAISLGLTGVTVSPICQGFHPAHSAAMRIYERCAEVGLPLFVTYEQSLTASAILEFGRPSIWDEVARSFPNLPIMITQLGHPWVDETLLLLGKHANVFADVSGVASRPWQLYNALLNASSFGVMDKILFGSGFPFDTPAKAIEAMYTINAYSHGTQLPSIPRSSIRRIIERDSLACLGIEAEISSALEGGPGETETEILVNGSNARQLRRAAGRADALDEM